MSCIKQQIRVIGSFLALALLALAASCRGFFVGNQIQSITIQPSSVTVPLGGTTQMHAFGVSTTGQQLGDVTSKVAWSSSSAAVTVNSTNQPGLLTGVALSQSTSTITASYQALTPQTATAAVCVEGGTNFVITPNNTTVSSTHAFPNNGGFTATVDAQVSGTSQNVDITSGVTWTSSNTNVLTIAGGVDPATVTMQTQTANVPVTITASYNCNGITISQTTVITVGP